MGNGHRWKHGNGHRVLKHGSGKKLVSYYVFKVSCQFWSATKIYLSCSISDPRAVEVFRTAKIIAGFEKLRFFMG